MKSLLPCLCFSIFLLACSDSGPEPESKTTLHPPVGVLKSNGYEVTLHTAPGGTLYTLREENGNLLAAEMTGKEFASRYPEIHDEIRGLWAGNQIQRPVPMETHGKAADRMTIQPLFPPEARSDE